MAPQSHPGRTCWAGQPRAVDDGVLPYGTHHPNHYFSDHMTVRLVGGPYCVGTPERGLWRHICREMLCELKSEVAVTCPHEHGSSFVAPADTPMARPRDNWRWQSLGASTPGTGTHCLVTTQPSSSHSREHVISSRGPGPKDGHSPGPSTLSRPAHPAPGDSGQEHTAPAAHCHAFLLGLRACGSSPASLGLGNKSGS